MRLLYFVVMLLLFLLSSCSNEEEKKLRASVGQELQLSDEDTIDSASVVLKEQYRAAEFQLNKTYAKALREQPARSFEKQLEVFGENELGFVKSYINMARYFFTSEEEWQDEMKVKSNRYFNSLEIEGDLELIRQQYLTDIKNIRSRFIHAQSSLPQASHIVLPEQQSSLASFANHTRNNAAIEIGTQLIEPIVGWLLGLLVIDVICARFAVKPPQNSDILIRILSAILFIISIISSVLLSINNDAKLEDALRRQNRHEYKINETAILKQLNQNTNYFYDTYQ